MGAKRPKRLVDIHCLSLCLFDCLYQIHVETTEPIGFKIFDATCTPGKVDGGSKFQDKIRFFLILFYIYDAKILTDSHNSKLKEKMGAKHPKSLVLLLYILTFTCNRALSFNSAFKLFPQKFS